MQKFADRPESGDEEAQKRAYPPRPRWPPCRPPERPPPQRLPTDGPPDSNTPPGSSPGGVFFFCLAQVTAERVMAYFSPLGVTRVDRYLLPQVRALNFVLHDGLAGGVTSSLRLDSHGKALSYALLALEIDDLRG